MGSVQTILETLCGLGFVVLLVSELIRVRAKYS